MALISDDLPQPFGPRMATCSPCRISKEMESSARLRPRIRVTLWNSRSGDAGIAKIILPMRTLWIGIGLLALAGAMPAQRTEELNFVLGLSQYRDFRNTLPHWLQRRAPDLLEQRKRAVSSAADRKALVRKRMNAVLGGFPERTPLNPRVVGTLERDGYRIEKIIFESQP